MSHTIGRLVTISPAHIIGPDGGVLTLDFTPPEPALTGDPPRFVILHFTAMNFPAGTSLEVSVGYGGAGYDKDKFSIDGEGWTRPIDPVPGPIHIAWVGGGGSGSVTLGEYASGEPTFTSAGGDSRTTNPDVFLHENPYTEPTYEHRLECGGAFNFDNVANSPDATVRDAAKAVCIIIGRDAELILSSCSGTLIDDDLVLTAEHCHADPSELEAHSGSVTFDFQTDATGHRPSPYQPVFHKIKRVVRRGTSPNPSPPTLVDWAILQIETPPGGLGITPRKLRPAGATAGEPCFTLHHPNGAVKKFQNGTLTSGDVTQVWNFDYAGGSSGSALFDAAGNIIGAALSKGPLDMALFGCEVAYCPATNVINALANPPAPPTPFDVMLVMDRSGSMGNPGTSMPGATKMDEAREAAKLFISLLREGAGDRVGMTSFSTTANHGAAIDTPLGAVTAAQKDALTHTTTGSIDHLTPGGSTSIGDGIEAGIEGLGAPGANQRALLVMTDGLQNTWPMISDAEGMIGSTKMCVVGFGGEADIDAALLTQLAHDHDGIFNRANDGLQLKKFFGLCFGNIFEAGALADPERILKAGEGTSKPVTFRVCEESRITAIVGWNDPSQDLVLSLRTPGGATLTSGTAGTTGSAGATWQFLRVPLPHGGERAGSWSWTVSRIIGGGEFPPPQVDVRYFVTVIADGGPILAPFPYKKRLYTGDAYNPLVQLRYPNGTSPKATIEVEIDGPAAAIGRLVSDARLSAPIVTGDAVDSFHATLQKIALQNGGSVPLPSRNVTVPLFDDGDHQDGAMEPDGVYGNPLSDLTRFEGTYNFHAQATFGDGCVASREAFWSITVHPSIDPGKTTVVVDGNTIRLTPHDIYGNPLGPGRGNVFTVSPLPGVTFTGPVTDNGDGSYSVPAKWDPALTPQPGVVVTQPDRPPVPLVPGGATGKVPAGCAPTWLLWLLIAGLFVLVVVLLILLLK